MPDSTMEGKVCLVTGASSGIGRVIAAELARRGATVLTTSRAEGSGDEVAAEIRRETGGEVRFLPADLSRMAEVRRLAARVDREAPRLDVLVNNAGMMFSERQTTDEGIERTFALDHLAYFLLSVLLAPKLIASAPARVVSTSSGAERFGRIHWDDLMLERGYGAWTAYGQAKLANLLFTFELARRLEGTGVSANALHPGFVATNFGRQGGVWGALLGVGQELFGRSAEKGAETAVYLASSAAVAGVSGGYFMDRQAVEPSARARDVEAQRRLWERSVELTGLTAEELAPLAVGAAPAFVGLAP